VNYEKTKGVLYETSCIRDARAVRQALEVGYNYLGTTFGDPKS